MEQDLSQYNQLFSDITLWVVVQVLLVIAVTWAAIFLLVRFVPRFADFLPAQFRMTALKSVPILRLLMIVIAIGLIVPLLFNVNFKNFVLVLGTVGVALGFALKDFANSAVAGVVAVIEQPYRTGDWVEIDGDYGEVVDVGTRALVLRTADDDHVSVPHLSLWNKNVINSNNGDHTLMCVVKFYLAPDEHAPGLRERLVEVAQTSAWLHYDRPIKVMLHHEPWATVAQLKAYPCDLRRQFDFITDLSARGRDALLQVGLRIVEVPVVAEQQSSSVKLSSARPGQG